MPEILSLALMERGGRTLVARRKGDRPPFAGRWLLPGTVVADDESAEEALERHLFRELSVEARGPEFVDTLYLEDVTTGRRLVGNVFRVARYEGEPRLRVAGDYDDARWLKADELHAVQVPVTLREWLLGGARPEAPEPRRVPVAAGEGPTPDNRAGWNAVSAAYQARYRLPSDRLVFGFGVPDEDALGVIGDVRGLRAIVLGCGGGQDCVALAKRGAANVVGIDQSDAQIAYGRKLAEQEGVLVTLLQGNVEELSGIDDESQDLALSLHAMNYVERADRALAEAYRVLRPASPFVLSVHHPFDAALEDEPPYCALRPYWEAQQDWEWEFPEQGVSTRMRSWYRPVSEWFSLLTDAGFRVERLLEPPAAEGDVDVSRYGGERLEKLRLVPSTLILRAVKA